MGSRDSSHCPKMSEHRPSRTRPATDAAKVLSSHFRGSSRADAIGAALLSIVSLRAAPFTPQRGREPPDPFRKKTEAPPQLAPANPLGQGKDPRDHWRVTSHG